MITKNELPILEFDDEQEGFISTKFNDVDTTEATPFPEKAVYVFLKQEIIEAFVESHNGKQLAVHKTVSKHYPAYLVKYKGQEICICQGGVGSPVAAEVVDWMIGHGVKKILACGSCGALEHIEEGEFLIPERALRDEGVSHKYLPPARYIELNKAFVEKIKISMQELGLNCERCTTWTTDSIYRETRDMVAYRREEGCKVVDMECASMAAVAEFRGAEFGQILFTADSLADTKQHNARNWGRDSHEKALNICMETIIKL